MFKLDKYNVKITVSDPDYPDTQVTASLERCDREKLIDVQFVGNLVRTLEDAVECSDNKNPTRE